MLGPGKGDTVPPRIQRIIVKEYKPKCAVLVLVLSERNSIFTKRAKEDKNDDTGKIRGHRKRKLTQDDEDEIRELYANDPWYILISN